MWKNSLGMYTVGATFVPAWYSTKQLKFKPMEYKRIDRETQEAKTTQSVCGISSQTKSGITPQDQQTTTQAAEQAQP